MRLLLASCLLVACSKSAPPSTTAAKPAAGSGSAAADCSKLDAPAKAMFDEMDRYITSMQQALDSAGSDCAKLTAGLRALDTDGYLRTMKQAALEMKPSMTPACQAHLDELGHSAETRFKPRFMKVLDEVNAIGPKCPQPEAQAAIESAMRVYKKKHGG